MVATSREERRFSIVLLLVQKTDSGGTNLCSEECMWLLRPRFTLVIGYSPLSVRGEDFE